MTDSPLVQALRSRKKPQDNAGDSEKLLQMILAQVTKMADYFSQDEKDEIVTTQESHVP